MRGTGLIARLGEADVQLEVPEPQVQDSAAAQCTMNARRMMTRITTTNQKKNTTIPGIAYPATVLALATDSSYPAQPELSAIAYGASPEGSAAASASQFRSACSGGSPLVRKVRRAALFTLLNLEPGHGRVIGAELIDQVALMQDVHQRSQGSGNAPAGDRG